MHFICTRGIHEKDIWSGISSTIFEDNVDTCINALYDNAYINDVLNVGNDIEITILELAEKTNLNPLTIRNRIKDLEKKGIIMGYFMMLDYTRFNLNTFKLLIKLEQNLFSTFCFLNFGKLNALLHYNSFCSKPNYK